MALKRLRRSETHLDDPPPTGKGSPAARSSGSLGSVGVPCPRSVSLDVGFRRLRGKRIILAAMRAPDIHRAIEAVWRIESATLIAGLTRLVRDVGLAETSRRRRSSPRSSAGPRRASRRSRGAWLKTTAKRRGIDVLRRDKRLAPKHEQIARDLEDRRTEPGSEIDAALDDPIGDDLLRLMFIACHPILGRGADRAHAAAPRRAGDGRDRAGLPRAGADRGAADRPRQAHLPTRGSPSRSARPDLRRASSRCSR